MLKQLLTKTLLVAAGLCAGMSAWAQSTAFSQDFTAFTPGEATEPSTDPSDYGFALSYGAGSSSTLVNFTVTDGVLKCTAGPYASSSAGARTGTATATFTAIGTGNEVTVSYTWNLGSATGNAAGSYTKTRIGNGNGNALELAFYGSDGGKLTVNGTTIFSNTAIRSTTYTITATLDMNEQKITALTMTNTKPAYNYSLTEYLNFASDITSIDRFAFENSERQNWANVSSIDDLNITYIEAKELVESIKVHYNYEGSTIYVDEISATGMYSGDVFTIPFRMYIVKDGELYQTANNTSNPYYGESTELVANTVVNKTVSKVNIGGSIEFFQDFDGSTGNNAGIRASYGSAYDNKGFTSEEYLPAGVYTFYVRAYSRNRGSSVKVGDTQVFTIADVGGSWQTKTFANVEVPYGGKLSFVAGGSNTIDPIDVIVAVKTADYTVSKSISAAGWATYCSPYALDFEGTGLTAYIVKGADSNGVLDKEEVTSVPANTGVLLKGDEGNYDIPVVASSSTNVTLNKMVGVTADTPLAAKSIWVLKGSPKIGFYCNSNAFTVGANTAYIPVDEGNFAAPAETTGAKTRFFSLDGDDATTINGIKGEKNADNAAIYNLAGQRVNGGYKGIVIKNGKKVFVK